MGRGRKASRMENIHRPSPTATLASKAMAQKEVRNQERFATLIRKLTTSEMRSPDSRR